METTPRTYELGRASGVERRAHGHGQVQSLQSLCLDLLASRLIARDLAFTSDALSCLPVEQLERLQQIMIAKNALNDHTLVMTTSSRQTSLTIPFSMTDDQQNLSEASVLQALTKCEGSLKVLHVISNDLTPPILEKITSEPLRSNLVTLSLSGCRVSLLAAQRILSSCASLQHLNLNGNPDINDELFVPVHSTTGARNGHVYSTRSGLMTSSIVSSDPIFRASRTKSKRSRSKASKSHSHPHVHQPHCDHMFDDIHMSGQVAFDFEPQTFVDLSTPDLHPTDLSFPPTNSTDSSEPSLDTFEPMAKRFCDPVLENRAFHRFASPSNGSLNGLITLHLSGTNLTNNSVEVISKLYPSLIDLDLSHCPHVSDLTPILIRCRSLRSLNISGSPVHSHSDTLLEYASHKPSPTSQYPFLEHLENLLFSGSGTLDPGFATWMRACGPTLLELRLSNKSLPEDPIGQHIHARNARAHLAAGLALSSDQLEHLPLFVRLLMPCQRLEVLDVHGLNVSANAMSLLFQAVKPSWTQTCQEFDVVNCDHITLEALAIVFDLPKSTMGVSDVEATWPKLKTLRISGGRHADTLAGPILPAIGAHACPQLEHLVLNNARAGKPLLRPVQLAQILQKFSSLRSVEVWCCTSISYSLATVMTQLCKQLQSVLLCVMGGGAPVVGDAALPHHLQHAQRHGRPIAPNALAVVAAAESMMLPAFLSPEQVAMLQKAHPGVEYKFWRHGADSHRQFQHIRPLSATGEPVSTLRPEQSTNQLSVVVEPTGEAHVELPLRSRLIRASVLIDGVPIWGGEKSASMHQLTQSIWGLVTHNAGAIPLVEDWCCACNIEEFNGVLFYDDAEFVYWDVLEPGPKAQFKFHKGQYVAAIAGAMQQQWNIFKGILPAAELVQQALLFTQQHAWHQQLLDKSKQQLQQRLTAQQQLHQQPLSSRPSLPSRA